VEDEEFHRIAKLVADPARFAALQMIAAQGEVSCSGLCQHLHLTPATISHHVKELSDAGLVFHRRAGKFLILSLNTARWGAYLRELARRIPPRVSRIS
jgi:ArsR family transcriptional regulator